MPFGGLSMFGAGLQLQPVTPGVVNIGNANLGGKLITQYLEAAWPSASNRRTQVYGNWTMGNGRTLADWTAGGVAIGNAMVLGSLECIVIGPGASNGNGWTSSCQNGVFIGQNCSWSGGYGGGQGAVAIGQNTQVNAAAVAIGGGAHGNATNGIAIGQNATVTQAGNISIGVRSDAGFSNVIILSTDRNASAANQLILGNATQTDAMVGPYRIGRSEGTTRTVADAAVVLGTTDGRVLYTSLTAARAVTLPAANAVPIGYTVQVVDMSGAASAVNTITTGPAGADTIVGPGSAVINAAYGSNKFMSDGVSKWNCVNNW